MNAHLAHISRRTCKECGTVYETKRDARECCVDTFGPAPFIPPHIKAIAAAQWAELDATGGQPADLEKWVRDGIRADDAARDCISCEGTGRAYNNADPTSNMWVPCECREAFAAKLDKGQRAYGRMG